MPLLFVPSFFSFSFLQSSVLRALTHGCRCSYDLPVCQDWGRGLKMLPVLLPSLACSLFLLGCGMFHMWQSPNCCTTPRGGGWGGPKKGGCVQFLRERKKQQVGQSCWSCWCRHLQLDPACLRSLSPPGTLLPGSTVHRRLLRLSMLVRLVSPSWSPCAHVCLRWHVDGGGGRSCGSGVCFLRRS